MNFELSKKQKELSTMTKNMYFNTAKKQWECSKCRRGFKERKDLEQHLTSGTHDAIRFACAEVSILIKHICLYAKLSRPLSSLFAVW